MLSDDVFREKLEQTLIDLEAWANATRDCADIEIAASPQYWRMAVSPHMVGACPFEMMINADQTFALKLAQEVYENRPVERFDLFVKLADAITDGNVARIEVRSALTDELLCIEMRVEMEPGWDWVGSRRIASPSAVLVTTEERRTDCFVPYRR